MKKLYIKLFSAAILLGLMAGVNAENKKDYKEADELFYLKKYQPALEKYLVLDASGDSNGYVRERIGDCYFYMFRYIDAEKYYSGVYRNDSSFRQPMISNYVETLVANNKYQEAEMVLVKHETMLNDTGRMQLRSIRWAMQQKPLNEDKYDIRMTGLETGGLCLGFTIWNQSVIYSVKQPSADPLNPDANYDLYIAKVGDDVYSFSDPAPLSSVFNRPFYEGSPTISKDGKMILYTSNVSDKSTYNARRPRKAGINSKGENVLHLYMAEKTDSSSGSWSKPAVLPFCDRDYNYIHPYLANDGVTLYFSTNQAGGAGGYDIYYSRYDAGNNTWSSPVNAGTGINTTMDELFPSSDAFNSLYFSSNGHPGYGGLDIFKATGDGTGWDKPVNIGSTINGSRDEFNLLPDSAGSSGYFASNRMSEGVDHIYGYKMTDYTTTYTFHTYDRESGESLDSVVISIRNKATGLEEYYLSDSAGNFSIVLYNSLPYQLVFRKTGYLTTRTELGGNRSDAREVKQEVPMDKTPLIVKENRITLNNIYFDFNKVTLRPESFAVLDEVVKYLQSEPDLQVELEAHTDSRGKDKYNLNLSQGRATSCVEYLISKGIDPVRMVPIGYGEYRLVNECKDGVECTEDQHQQNRRVELKLIRKNGDVSSYVNDVKK